jgi:glutamine---fructose-6-phosphate transaminase (isomerizing)
MCGITGYIGNKTAFKLLLEGLKQLQNRGYDSAGICTLSQNGEFTLNKFASVNNLSAIEKLESIKLSSDYNGIGHTRWATHGPKTDENSHPHNCMHDEISIVHNGIIENYQKLKNFLIKNNYTFKSQTDTEVIVNLISYEFKKTNDILESIRNTINKLEGTYALCILNINEPNKLYCVRHGSPLLISKGDDYAYIASEQSGLYYKSNSYICLKNEDICILEKKNNEIIMTTNNKYIPRKISSLNKIKTPYPYNHWMLKEIYEQKESCKRAVSYGGRLLSDNRVKLGGLESNRDNLKKIDNLILLGCGTSYFAGLTSIDYFKNICNFNTVQIFDGAEFKKNDIPKMGQTAIVLLSQSGETKDLHRCIKIGKDNDLFLIGVVNVIDSLIARETNCGCYLNAGREMAVASTKSFTSQCILLSMIAIWFAQIHDINSNKRLQYINDLRNLEEDISNILENGENYKIISEKLYKKNSIFILGKGNIEAIAKEASLKIKEVTYIHAEGYSGSSLKHGPFGLLEKGYPVILIDTDDNHYNKMNNVYEEIISRYASVFTITNNLDYNRDNTIMIPFNNTYNNLLSIIPLQLISYEISVKKNINPDFPRNLAKVVTVE